MNSYSRTYLDIPIAQGENANKKAEIIPTVLFMFLVKKYMRAIEVEPSNTRGNLAKKTEYWLNILKIVIFQK